MKHKQPARTGRGWIPGTFLLTFSALLIWVLTDKADNQTEVSNTETAEVSQTAARDPVIVASGPAKTAKDLTPTERDETGPVLQAEDEPPFFETEVKARLTQVRDQFAEDIQYPPFSRPIRNAQELAKYQPNRSSESATPTDFDNPEAPGLSLQMSKYRFTEGEAVEALARISDLDSSRYSRVSARIMSGRKVLARVRDVSASGIQAHHYPILFDQPEALTQSAGNDFVLIADFEIDGEHFEVAAPFSYVSAVALIETVQPASVVGATLQIPVQILVSQPGLHKLTANLYDAASGQPLLNLSSRELLENDQPLLTLRAHITALRAMGKEGPYELRDLSLQRLPTAPRYLTEFGSSVSDSFAVTGFPFTDYEDQPYENERARARLDFLSRIGGEPDS